MPGDTLHINNKAKTQNTYDAIVVGSGISGGWAAKELCEKGLKTLVQERGRNVEHIKDYPTANLAPWELRHRGKITEKYREVIFRIGQDGNLAAPCLFTFHPVRIDNHIHSITHFCMIPAIRIFKIIIY